MTFADIQKESWAVAEEKGFHEAFAHLPEREATLIRLGLAHTEISEAMQEAKRHGITEKSVLKIAEELADTIIRIADLAECLGLNLGFAVREKIIINRARPQNYGTPLEEKG